MRQLTDSELAKFQAWQEYAAKYATRPNHIWPFDHGFDAGLDYRQAEIAALTAERDGLAKQVKDLEELRDYLSDKLQEARQFQANQREVNAIQARQLKKAEAALADCDEARRAPGEAPTT